MARLPLTVKFHYQEDQMKQHRVQKEKPVPAFIQEPKGKTGRFEMNGFFRGLVVAILILLIFAIILAGGAALYPDRAVVTLPTNVLRYQRSSQVDYVVLARPNPFTNLVELGMDQTYLRDYSDAVDATFTYDFQADRPVSLAWNYVLDAEIQVRDAADPVKILLRNPLNLVPAQTGAAVDGHMRIQQTAHFSLVEYRQLANRYQPQPGVDVNFVLAVRLSITLQAALPVENLVLSEGPSLLIPLNLPEFQISREGVGQDSRTIEQPVRYQFLLKPIAFPIYPAAAGFCLLLLVLFLATTRRRRQNAEECELRHIIKRNRRRLLLIADKAWEPEWCIKVSSLNSMFGTAEKLNQPVFCYIDQKSESTAAYFYIHLGENNFCYTFSGDQTTPQTTTPASPPPKAGSQTPETQAPIPLLPETDDRQGLF
jgi:hypothetical protein